MRAGITIERRKPGTVSRQRDILPIKRQSLDVCGCLAANPAALRQFAGKCQRRGAQSRRRSMG